MSQHHQPCSDYQSIPPLSLPLPAMTGSDASQLILCRNSLKELAALWKVVLPENYLSIMADVEDHTDKVCSLVKHRGGPPLDPERWQH